MLLTLVLGMNIIAAKIKPKPVCLMPSDKRACGQLWHHTVGLARLSTQEFIAYTQAASKSCVAPAFEYSCSKMAQKEFGTAICSVFTCHRKIGSSRPGIRVVRNLCLQVIGKYNGTTLSLTSPWFGSELTLLPYVVHDGDSVSPHHRQTGLQSDLPGLGFDLHPNPSPGPNKPIGAGVGQKPPAREVEAVSASISPVVVSSPTVASSQEEDGATEAPPNWINLSSYWSGSAARKIWSVPGRPLAVVRGERQADGLFAG
ncbi:hypothetical protein DFH09DRAFT_1096006 [Mycena vulgaris]|nr:hypothetical protein DFH09DRAFT_1096006 [Mycena vulgaris]